MRLLYYKEVGDLVIQHNMSALNADRMLGLTHLNLADSAEKLSSGYKINRAADDAAGLSISEKMRKKIRGLERGMENVQDGISLCQVADGALNEVADMLQRVRELSIQAYNGTNSKNDRHMIQDEVSQCINELDRVFETTKFNEIYIFRNGCRVQGETFHPETHIVQDSMTVARDIPAWLQINDQTVAPGTQPEIEVHQNYLQNQTQYMDGIMKHDFAYGGKNNPQYAKLYFGKNQGTTADGYQWAGNFIKNPATQAYKELMQPGNAFYDYISQHLDNNGNYTGWTPTITDNVSAKVDFSELAGVKDASELYNKLSELVGTELGFPCGSCSLMEAVRFSGEYVGMRDLKFHSVNSYIVTKEINLSGKAFIWDNKEYEGYFNAILEVEAMEDTDPDKVAKTGSLAKAIAEDLAKSTYDVLNGAMTTHYDRAVQVMGDPYSVYVYDYRDIDAISPGNSISNKIWTYSMVSFEYDKEVDGGYYTHYDYWDANQIWIQASDEAGDGIPIYSHHLSAEILKLEDYRVDTYASEITWEDEDAYQERLAAWLAKIPEPKTETYKTTVSVLTKYEPPVYRVYYENGELKQEVSKPAVYEYQNEQREYVRQIYDMSAAGPRPVRSCTVREVYAPSELSLVDDAMEKVNEVRSYYGAVQNRLEHTYRNNYNADENLTYAESRIRDTDMAKEMVRNSLLNILQQAGLSMLSQANQTNQGVNMLLS